jgi:hypothetical protein
MHPPLPEPPRLRSRRVRWWALALLVVALLGIIIFWHLQDQRLQQNIASDLRDRQYVYVSFNASAPPYASALTDLSDLGLRLANHCTELFVAGRYSVYWDPESSDRLYYEGDDHFLEVLPTVLAPHDWQQRLSALPYVGRVDQQIGYCDETNMYRDFVHPVNALLAPFTTPLQSSPWEVAAVSPTATYQATVGQIMDLGLRLADPCYEARLARGEHPPQSSPSQAAAFGQTRTLVIAASLYTPPNWEQRLNDGGIYVSRHAQCSA